MNPAASCVLDAFLTSTEIVPTLNVEEEKCSCDFVY